MNRSVILYLTLFVLTVEIAYPTSLSTDTLRIDFNHFVGSGISTDTTGGRLDSNIWMIHGLSDGSTIYGGNYLSGDFARGMSNGRVTTGGVYAFRVNDSTKVLGFQPTGTDLAPGSVTFKAGIGNLQGGSRIGIEYDLYVMNDQGRSTAIDLWWSVDTLQWVLMDNRFTTPTTADESPTWNKARISAIIGEISVTEIDTIHFRWTMSDAGGTGSRDEWGLTNIYVFLTDKSGPFQPEPLQMIVKWDFDDETDVPNPVSIDNVDAQFGIAGARRSGYAAGTPGRAANANQWNNPVSSYWYTRVSTVGYDSIHVNSWHYSSSTGPSKFILEWSIDSLGWYSVINDEFSVGNNYQKMSASAIALPDEISDTNRIWLRWLRSSTLAVNGQELGASGTSRIDDITLEGRFVGARLPFASAPIITLSGDEHFADIFIETTGTSIINSSLLQCTRTDADSTFSIPATITIRQQQRLTLPELPRPSTWNCMILLSSDVGEFESVSSEIIVEPPPPPFAEKPDLPASDIQLLHRTDKTLQLAWTPGSGESRLFLIKPTSETVCFAKVSTTYQFHPNPVYADTTNGGCKVVYNGSASVAKIIGLNPLHDVIVTVVEYNGEPGREHYLNEDTLATTFRTRSVPPEALKELGVLQVMHDHAYLNWLKPITGLVHIVAADSGWFGPERMLAFDPDEYQKFDTTGAIELCSNTTPCIINKEQVDGKLLYGWAVDGPYGHKSHQSEMPTKLHIDWPNDQTLVALASWSFNTEMLETDNSIWEYRESEIDLIGARHRGFITGFDGRAANSDQWDNGSGTKGWSITLSTMSLIKLNVAFRLLSSSTGPAHFRFSCQVDQVDEEYVTDTTILSQSTWALSGIQSVSVPVECLGHPRVDLRLLMANNISVNGNTVSRTGTSRIDDLRLSGQFGQLQEPVLDIPVVIRNTDEELILQSHIVAGAGHIPISRYLLLESDSGSIHVSLDPLSASTVISLINGSKKASTYQAYHCIDISVKTSCSLPTEFRTPYPIPQAPDYIDLVTNKPDSTVLAVYPSERDSWVVISDIYQSMPIAIDSIGIVKPNQKDWIHSQRLPAGSTSVIASLTPGNTYRIWALSVNGDSSSMRFSRPSHPYIDVKIPDLIAPFVNIDSIRIVSLTTDHVELQWLNSDAKPILISISGIESSIELPDPNAIYRANSFYGEGDAITKNSYVVGNGILHSIRIRQLPLGRTWRLQIIPYNELKGSIAYANDDAVYYTFDTQYDPLSNTSTAREIVQLTDSSTVHVVGSVLWASEDLGILHTIDGNIQIQWGSIVSQTFRSGDSIAIRGLLLDGIVIADYVSRLGNSTVNIQPIEILSDVPLINAVREKHIALGNLMIGSLNQTSDMIFEQRGLRRRVVNIVGSDETVAIMREMSETVAEFSIVGIPLVDRSDSLLRVFIQDSKHIIEYPRVQILKESPNKDQLITWSTSTADTVAFAWKIDIGIRPYDVFPDSAFSGFYFISRSVGDNSAIVRNQKMITSELRLSARDLHREHIGVDSLRDYVEIEWTLVPSEVAESMLSNSMEIESDWYSYQLVRLQSVSIGDLLDLPTEFALSDPRPNPFNPSTMIRIDVPENGDLAVRIYDITGRLVTQLRSGNVSAGVHFITWDATRIASGIYVITTVYINRRYSKLVTLIK